MADEASVGTESTAAEVRAGALRPPGTSTPLWPIALTAVAIAMAGGAVWSIRSDALLEIDRWALFNRALARMSFLLFIPIFSASPLLRWAPGETTRALARIRRSLGLSYALVMASHAAAIIAGARAAAELGVGEFNYAKLSVGAMGFLLIGAMAVTSNDAAVRRMGGKAWRRLHGIGIWVLWGFYLATYSSRIAEFGGEWIPGLVAVIGLALFRWSVRLERA